MGYDSNGIDDNVTAAQVLAEGSDLLLSGRTSSASGIRFYSNPSTAANGVTITAADSTTDGVYRFGFGDNNSTGTSTFQYNFGSGFFGTTAVASANADGNGIGAFEYAVPTGYYAVCTKNIKEFGG